MSKISLASPQPYSLKEAEAASVLKLLGSYTMCPNWIYDTLLVNESPSVIKVVMYFNRNTIGRTGQDGQRVERLQASYGWIARKMEMSLRAVGEAMRTALAKGYLVMVKAPRAATDKTPGEGGSYSLNWNWPASKSETETLTKDQLSTQPRLLSEQAGQVLPACINTPKLNSNKPIEIKCGEHKPIPALAASTSTGFGSDSYERTKSGKANQPNGHLAQTRCRRKGSTSIGCLISDFSREFGDKAELIPASIGRALNLWQKSNVSESESEFIKLLYDARQKTLASGSRMRHRRQVQVKDSCTNPLPNRMPYFFAVLEDLVSVCARTGQDQSTTNKELDKAKRRRWVLALKDCHTG